MSGATNFAVASGKGTLRDEFDYVVVGGGASGCVIANRLTEDPATSVLLLDAGGPEPYPPMDQYALMGSKFDWKYQTEPEPHLDDRRIAWPRGKLFGGSSAISGMVYLRGNRLDYDHWNYLGNQGWAYDEVLPYFRKSETNKQYQGEFHGQHGPLSVEAISDQSLLKQAFLEAAGACGFRGDANWDFNGAKQEGVAGLYQKTLKNGVNHSVGAAYLTPFLDRQNLIPRAFSMATKLVWDRNRICGVDYVSADWNSTENSLVPYLPGLWKTHTVRARREVIVSAGVVESPQLLMLSGIGPAEHLRRHGIAVKVDLPGVGQHLYDHLSVTLTYKPNANAGNICDRIGSAGLLLRTKHGFPSASPDLQLVIVEVLVTQATLGLQPGPLYFCAVNGVQPCSVGSISLASADPLRAPLIRANYLQSGHDLGVMLDGVRLIRRLTQSASLRKLLDAELVPGPNCRTDDEIRAVVRQTSTTGFHPVGSCKMGHDAMAVVDDRLRVHGVEGLRVADASIMPAIVNTNTIGPCVMIGEKAAEMIRSD